MRHRVQANLFLPPVFGCARRSTASSTIGHRRQHHHRVDDNHDW